MFHFFAYIARMRAIRRWGLMDSHLPENVAEHTLMTAVLAHALAVIAQELGEEDADPNGCAAAALFHDAPEILTGDLPTPVKYFSAGIRDAYRAVEEAGAEKLLSTLPESYRAAYRALLKPEDARIERIVSAADKLSAYIKCLEELRSGNTEFRDAARATREKLDAMDMPELRVFFEKFLPSFSLTLDAMR